MDKVHIKFWIFLLAAACALIIGLVGFSRLTSFITDFQRGADPASIFRGNQLTVPRSQQALWLADTTSVLSPTLSEREEILAAYWNAWEALSRAHVTGDSADLPTYWAGDAYHTAVQAVSFEPHFTQEHSGHQLRLTFYSSDGSVVAFEDDGVRIHQTMNRQETNLTLSASVVMTLDNSFWRIRAITMRYR